MLIDERQTQIKELLDKNGYLTIEQIAKEIFTSTATVRRDLIDLEKLGLVRRVRGGAKSLNRSNNDTSTSFRFRENLQLKDKIGKECVRFLKNDSTYFVDSSTTVANLLPYFEALKNVQVYTNGLDNALILSKFKNIDSYILGGKLYSDVCSVGETVIVEMAAIRTDFCIISCKGLTIEGPMEGNISSREIKACMIGNSNYHILLVDHTKFDQKYLCFSATWSQIDLIITNDVPREEYLEVFKKYNIKLVVAK